jgi:hypothetical protein
MSISKPRPVRTLISLSVAFAAGQLCLRNLRFTQTIPNYVFFTIVLLLPFFAIRPVLQLRRLAKVLGFFVLSPILFLSLLMMFLSVACGAPELAGNNNSGCMKELGHVNQGAYSVHMVRDGCGGAMVSFLVFVEQRVPLLPGIYRFRIIDSFDRAYEGTLTSVGPDAVRVQIPQGVSGSGWNKEVDRVYQLNRNAFF